MEQVDLAPMLTDRERQILELIASGYSAKEVALRCAIGHRTVETHLDTMRLKLRARNRTHMVAMALTSNLLTQGFERMGGSPSASGQGNAAVHLGLGGQIDPGIPVAAPAISAVPAARALDAPKRPTWFLSVE